MPTVEPLSLRANTANGLGLTQFGLLLAALAAQLVLLALAMPLTELTSGNWFFHIDNPFHIYQLELGRALLSEGQLAGYDPFFGAGHLAGLASNVSARFSLAIAALMPASVPIATVYAVYVLACSLAAPVSLWALGQLLQWPYLQRIFAIVFGLLLWWIGIPHWYHTAGMVSFVCACYFAPPYAAWVYSLCNASNTIRPVALLGAGLIGGAGMWLHPLFCIPVVVLCLSFALIGTARPKIRPFLGRATTIAGVVVMLSLPWVLALSNSVPTSDSHGYQRAVGFDVLFNSLGLGTGGALGASINLFLLGICLIGIWIDRGGKQSAMWAFLVAGIGLLVLSAFGGSSATLAYIQPNRFLGPAYLLIGMAAAYKVPSLVTWASTKATRTVKMGMYAGGLLFFLFFGRELIREVMPGSHGHHGKAPPEIGTPPTVVAQLENWVNTNTTTDGRILFETSLGRVHGGGHIAGYLAAKTRREFLGAAYPYFLPRLSCWDRSCFDRPISEMSSDFFGRAIDTYNVGWIVAHSDELKRFLQQIPNIKMTGDFGGISTYEVGGSHTFIHSGAANIVGRDFNRIDFSNVIGQTLTLRYNWVSGLETVPPSQIEPHQWSPDFPPLIRIVNPPASFTLRLARQS